MTIIFIVVQSNIQFLKELISLSLFIHILVFSTYRRFMYHSGAWVNVQMLRNKNSHYSRSLVVLDYLFVFNSMFFYVNSMLFNLISLKLIIHIKKALVSLFSVSLHIKMCHTKVILANEIQSIIIMFHMWAVLRYFFL